MNKSVLLIAAITLALVAPSYADFTDIAGKILPLNSTEAARNYTVAFSAGSNARSALFTGIPLMTNHSSSGGNASATNSSTPSSNNTGVGDTLLYSLDTNTSLVLKLAYSKSMQNLTANSSTLIPDFASIIQHLSIVEFSNSDMIPGFQLGADNITGNYNLSHPDLKWNLTLNQTQASDINGTAYTFYSLIAETSDKVFAIRLLIGGRAANVSGYEVKPDEVKYDVRIRWFNNSQHVANPWTTGPSNTSANGQLAILSAFAASQGTLAQNNTVGDKFNSSEVSFKAPQYESFFRWAAKAKVYSNATTTNSNTTQNSTASNSTATNSTSAAGNEQMSVVTVSVISTANSTNLASLIPINGTLNATIPSNWTSLLVFHAFDAIKPEELLLDPQFGLRLGSSQPSIKGRRAFLSWFY